VRRGVGSPAIAEACFAAAELYANGSGGEGTLFRAFRYYRRACNLGYQEACGR
jgi:TPR repeat protein